MKNGRRRDDPPAARQVVPPGGDGNRFGTYRAEARLATPNLPLVDLKRGELLSRGASSLSSFSCFLCFLPKQCVYVPPKASTESSSSTPMAATSRVSPSSTCSRPPTLMLPARCGPRMTPEDTSCWFWIHSPIS